MATRARWLEAPPEGWDALRRGDPNATPLHRHETTRAMVETMPGCVARFLAVEREGTLIGGMPLVIERRFGCEWLRAMPFTLGGAPIAAPAAHASVDRAAAEALVALGMERQVTGGEWVGFRPVGPPMDPATLAILPGETRVTHTDVVDLSSGAQAAYRRLERKTRESIASSQARGLRCVEDPEALDETYALYAGQARHWPGHRFKPLPLLRRLLEGPSPAGRLFTVRDSRGLLAGTLALVGEHEWMPWWSGSHVDARRRQAFTSLLWSVAESAARAGAARLNLGASAGLESVASFKKALGAHAIEVPIRWIGAQHAPLWGRAVASIQQRMRARRWRGAPA